MPSLPRLAVLAAASALVLLLAACGPTIGLAPGLTARMDAAGARLDTVAAFGLINHLRRSRGAPELQSDAALESAASQAARSYAATGKSPAAPDGAGAILTSAGYLSFAETFSGWRGSEKNTAALADPSMRRAGLAVAYDGKSEFGAHWVLLQAE
ncbi:MAG: hypothetical protein KKH72_01730 [Alphaproteobacteria bacterium]|nr:hypothetical protein [Alphaproteobacteria bacterium]